MESVIFRPERLTKLLIVPRDGSQPVQTVEVPALFNFHYGNGYEEENGDIVFGKSYITIYVCMICID